MQKLCRLTLIGERRLFQLAIAFFFIATMLLKAALPVLGQQGSPQLPIAQDVRDAATRANDYWTAHRPGPEDNKWSRAVYFTGNMAHYHMSGDSRYLDNAWTWAESASNWQLDGGCTTVFADNQAAGQTYVALREFDPQRANITCLLSSIETSMSWGWIEVDLGATTYINRVTLDAFQDRRYRYLVDVKSDPSEPYTMALDRSDAPPDEPEFAGVSARFVRLRVIGADGYTGEWVSLTEFRIFGETEPNTNLALDRPVTCSSEPEPQNSCANAVDGDLSTRWSASFPSNFSEGSPNWWWIDALYMAAPVYSSLSRLETQNALQVRTGYSAVLFAKYDETKQQRGLYDEVEHLWYRDTRFLTMRSPNQKEIFWSRGNGWVFAALVRVLDTLPIDDPHFGEYLSTFEAMADALLDKQDPAGYWNENLADPSHCGGPETSGTAFFAYGLAWGINQGVLDRAAFLPTVVAAWDWLAITALQDEPDGLVGYVQAVGDQPVCSEDLPLPGPADSADFGVGSFLLAASEVYRLATAGSLDTALHLPLITR